MRRQVGFCDSDLPRGRTCFWTAEGQDGTLRGDHRNRPRHAQDRHGKHRLQHAALCLAARKTESRLRPTGQIAAASPKIAVPAQLIKTKAAKAAKSVAPRLLNRPLAAYLVRRGRIRTNTPLARLLSTRGITPRTFPGLFSKEGKIYALDNLPRDEFEGVFGYAGDSATDVGNERNYVSQDELIAGLEAEMRGTPLQLCHRVRRTLQVLLYS